MKTYLVIGQISASWMVGMGALGVLWSRIPNVDTTRLDAALIGLTLASIVGIVLAGTWP